MKRIFLIGLIIFISINSFSQGTINILNTTSGYIKFQLTGIRYDVNSSCPMLLGNINNIPGNYVALLPPGQTLTFSGYNTTSGEAGFPNNTFPYYRPGTTSPSMLTANAAEATYGNSVGSGTLRSRWGVCKFTYHTTSSSPALDGYYVSTHEVNEYFNCYSFNDNYSGTYVNAVLISNGIVGGSYNWDVIFY